MTDSFNFKKKYGQNFLKYDSVCKNIVDCCSIKENSLVIEIGPGSGMLTKFLLDNKNVSNLICYEIDQDLEDILKNKFDNNNKFNIIFDDFLNRNIKNDIKKYSYDNLYIVGNLPYYITTPIINKIIDEDINVKKIVVMVQKEVALRYSSKPNSKDYSSITVFLNYYFDINKEFIVNKNMFNPRPNVDSMVISLTKKDKMLDVRNKEIFFKLVRDSFRFKRKTIKNNLREYDLNVIEKVLNKYGYDLNVRSEDLKLEIFVDISNNL